MKAQITNFIHGFINPKYLIFAVALLNFVWVWLYSHWHFSENIFLATSIVIASVMLLIDRVWSKVIAIFIASYLPVAVIREAWKMHSSTGSLNYRSFILWFIPNANVDEWPILCLDLAIVILGYASYTLVRRAKSQVTNDA